VALWRNAGATLLQNGKTPAALRIAADFAERFPKMTYSPSFMRNAGREWPIQRYAALMTSLNLLPCEGSTEAHSLFREAHLMLATERLKPLRTPMH